MDYVKTLKDIAIELVEDKEHLEVRQMPSLDENVVVLHVYSAKNDIAKLIGRKGVMANSIRQLMSVENLKYVLLVISMIKDLLWDISFT